MQPLPLDPAFEAFLGRTSPGSAAQWQGATPEEIARIEQLAGRPLPDFYRGFLARMGREMGPQRCATVDFSAAKVISCYEEGLVAPDPSFLLIGWESDEVVPMHTFYDLDRPARGDALITRRYASGGEGLPQFETLRELLAWSELVRRIRTMPQRCRGSFADSRGDILPRLATVMASLGFSEPLATGPCCGLFDHPHAALASSSTPEDTPSEFHFFRLGAADAVTIRRILAAVTTETPLKVKIREWEPPLP